MGTGVGRDICHPRTTDSELEMGRLSMCLPVLVIRVTGFGTTQLWKP